MPSSLVYICGNPTYSVDSPSGYSTRMRELCKGFEAVGYQTAIHLPGRAVQMVTRATSKHRSILKSFVPRGLWEVLRDFSRIRSDERFDQELPKRIGDCPDIIYECLDYSGSVAYHLREACPAKYILEIHGPLEEDARLTAGARPLQFLFSKRVRRALPHADYIVVISTMVRDWLLTEGVAADRIIVLPNGANLEEFDPARFPSRPTSPSKLVIGFVGSDLVWHRLDALIEAFSLVPANIPAHLQIVGIASANENLRRMVSERRIESRVSFLGSVAHDQIPAAIAAFDICVMPGSNRYGSPIKIFEYGAMGKAIIAPDEVPVREVMVDGEDGLLIPSGDVQKIKDAIVRLATDHELRERMARTFQEKVRSQYGWVHIAKAISDRIRA